MPGVRSVAFGAWVRAASLHEPRERMGISHLLEHMVFKGTQRRNAHEIALSLEALGGSLDAYTSREHTVYQGRVLDEHLADAADVIGDIVFRPALRASDLALERKVILEEIGMVEDTPDDLVFEIHNEALWGSHPYGYSILGTRDTVNALGVPRAARPPRAGVPPRARRGRRRGQRRARSAARRARAHRLDGRSRRGHDAARLAAAGRRRRRARATFARDGAQTHIVAGCAALSHADPERFPLLLLSTLLGGGMSSRLFQRVREELGLAYAIYSFQSFHADSGMHGVYVATAPESAGDALDAIRHELQLVVDDGLPADEVAMGRQQLKGQVTLSLESVSSRMYRAASVELYDEPYRTLDEVLALIDVITVDDVARVARAYFDPSRMTVVSLGPKGTD